MKSILSNVIIFAAGAAIGSAVTWKILGEKFDQRLQEEIEAMKARYDKYDDEELENVEPEIEEAPEESTKIHPNILEHRSIVREANYINYSSGENINASVKPRTISPDEYGDDDYEMISLTYYSDGVLTDDLTDDIIEDIDDTVGKDSLTRFGEYEDDLVYVRNDERKCDYEISRDVRRYMDVVRDDIADPGE